MTAPTIYEPIPQPPGYPVLGNLFDIRGAETPIQALMKLARQYGPIYQLRVGPRRLNVVSGFDLVDELCDEKRFDKMLGAGLLKDCPSRPRPYDPGCSAVAVTCPLRRAHLAFNQVAHELHATGVEGHPPPR